MEWLRNAAGCVTKISFIFRQNLCSATASQRWQRIINSFFFLGSLLLLNDKEQVNLSIYTRPNIEYTGTLGTKMRKKQWQNACIERARQNGKIDLTLTLSFVLSFLHRRFFPLFWWIVNYNLASLLLSCRRYCSVSMLIKHRTWCSHHRLIDIEALINRFRKKIRKTHADSDKIDWFILGWCQMAADNLNILILNSTFLFQKSVVFCVACNIFACHAFAHICFMNTKVFIEWEKNNDVQIYSDAFVSCNLSQLN